MPICLALCLEELDVGSRSSRYVRCVAVPGRQQGLRVDHAGDVQWRSERDVAFELWVSADDKLILYRPEGAAVATLHRAGRHLDVPVGKPVVVLDQDEVAIAARRYRIHLHGPADAMTAPAPLAPRAPRTWLRAAAAAFAVGATVGAGSPGGSGGEDAGAVATSDAPSDLASGGAAGAEPVDAGMNDAAADGAAPDEIEVRMNPPEPPPPEPPPSGCCGRHPAEVAAMSRRPKRVD